MARSKFGIWAYHLNGLLLSFQKIINIETRISLKLIKLLLYSEWYELVNPPDRGVEGDLFTILDSLLNHPRKQALKIKDRLWYPNYIDSNNIGQMNNV